MIRRILLLFVTLAVVIPISSTATTQAHANPLSLGVTDLDGKASQLPRKQETSFIVLVSLLADCPACESYSRTLNQLSKDYEKKGVQFAGLFSDRFTTFDEARQFQKTYSIRFPLYRDEGNKMVHALGITVAPQVIVMDVTGVIRYSGRIDDWMYAIGKKRTTITNRDLKNALDKLCQGQEPSPARTTPIGCIISEP